MRQKCVFPPCSSPSSVTHVPPLFRGCLVRLTLAAQMAATCAYATPALLCSRHARWRLFVASTQMAERWQLGTLQPRLSTNTMPGLTCFLQQRPCASPWSRRADQDKGVHAIHGRGGMGWIRQDFDMFSISPAHRSAKVQRPLPGAKIRVTSQDARLHARGCYLTIVRLTQPRCLHETSTTPGMINRPEEIPAKQS